MMLLTAFSKLQGTTGIPIECIIQIACVSGAIGGVHKHQQVPAFSRKVAATKVDSHPRKGVRYSCGEGGGGAGMRLVSCSLWPGKLRFAAWKPAKAVG